MKNAVAYVRVSTDNQAENGFGADIQRGIIKQYAIDKGYTIIDWVEDLGVSGATDIKSRPALKKLVYGDVYNPPVEAIIVAKSDRVSRDINIYYGIRYLLSSKSIELVSAEMDFGQFGAFSSMIETLLATLAELEKEKINQRTTGGRLEKAKRGGYTGGGSPFGYSVVNGELIIDEDDANIVKQIFKWRSEKVPYRTIPILTKELGLKSKRGGDFTKGTIQVILENEPTYRGFYRYGDMDWVVGQHAPILTDDDPSFMPELIAKLDEMRR